LESESRAQGITDAEAESTFGAIESGNSIPLRPLEKIDILSTLSCCIVSESNMSILESKSIKIMALARIGLDEVGISYCDGSCKSDKSAGYSAAILAPGDSLGSASAESFTGRKMSCRILSGAIPNGTNNIGELSGVKCCIENFGGNTVQIINSDSAYAIGIFREWISRWKSNGFMTRSGKVSNCGLIKSIDSELGLSNKIVLFRWVEGHRGDHFNELCDEAAKEAAGA
jgi:ribonuclease HI